MSYLSHNGHYSCYNWTKHLTLCSLVAKGKRDIPLVTYVLPSLCGKITLVSPGKKLNFY